MKQSYSYNLLQALAVLVIMLTSQSLASQRTVSGVVTDTEGVTLIGANVTVQGTSTGTVTDIDGTYSLQVPDEAEYLVYSYTGYETVELAITGTAMDVTLAEGQLLDEVVVIGYGEVKREDATGSVAMITNESFNKGAIANPQQLLAGKVAGVAITTDGSPGGGADIRIRGESSLGASNNPLFIIDGIPIEGGETSGARNPLNLLNPADIESMTVLKDASATAIYGSRASGGVIIITTKKGKSGQFKLGYNASVATGSILNRIDNLSADEFRDAARTYIDTSNSTLEFLRDDISTDWQDQVFQRSFVTDHNVTMSGGILGLPIRASLGYSDFDGLVLTDEFKRYSGSLNLSPSYLDNTLQLRLGVKASRVDNQFGDKGAIGSAAGFDPTKPVRSGDTAFGGYFTWLDADGNVKGLAPANPVALLQQKDDRSTVDRYITNASVDYRMPFLPALRANLNLGYDYTKAEGSVLIDTTAAFAYNPITGGGTNNTYSEEKKNSLLEFYLNYKKELFGNDFDIMAGYSWQKFEFDKINDDSDFRGIEVDSTRIDRGELFILSLFGRVNYQLGDRVLLTGTLRQDQTSRFSPSERTGIFPSGAVAVKLRETEGDIFNSLKLRLSAGVTGQQDIGGYYLWQGLYEGSDNATRYIIGNDTITTVRPNGYDRDIRWEQTTTYNAGLDFSLIRGRLGGTIDVYRRNTTDLLVSDVPAVVGSNLTNIITTNLGNMTSQGVEIGLNMTPMLKENSRWDVSLNAAFNRNEVTKLSNDSTSFGIAVGGISGGVGNNIQIHSVGFQPYAFFVFEQVYDEAGNMIPGEFVDRDGDGAITDNDKYRIEATRPRATLGLTSNLAVGNVDFSFAARANLGTKVYNNIQSAFGNTTRLAQNGVLNNIHPVGVEQEIELEAQATFSDHFVQNASFLRVDHITVGYTFDKLVGDFLRIYTTVQNPLLISSYPGLDPEVFSGIDNNIYPRARTFVFGLGVQF